MTMNIYLEQFSIVHTFMLFNIFSTDNNTIYYHHYHNNLTPKFSPILMNKNFFLKQSTLYIMKSLYSQ